MTGPRARLALIAFGLFAAACSTVPPASDSGAVVSAWVEMVPGGGAEVRAITGETTCPALTVDGGPRLMQVRALADGKDFPVAVCVAPLPAGARSAAVTGRALPLPKSAPRRILVIGDMIVGTGGTALDDPITQSLTGMIIDGANVTTGKTSHGFGYVTMEPLAEGWRATVHDVEGRPVTECALARGTLTCAP
ncbi:MAG TPA: hypothetical protein VK548_21600 [Candidatus Acidoferrum sp.]|nr:hypothetical protein [Candidatus Acidoferrum sp.]